MTQSAQEIYQQYLDVTSALLMRGEHEKISHIFTFPNRMETLDGLLVFHTPEEMVTATQEFQAYILRMGGSDFFRICREAKFAGETCTTITGRHESYILKRGTYMVEPYHNELTLEYQNGQWLGSVFRTLAPNATVPILSPKQLRERALAKSQEIKGNEAHG